MSITRLALRTRIQELLGDTNPAERVVNQFRYDEVIQRNVHLISSRIYVPRESTATVNLVAGTYDYTLATGVTASDINSVILNSTGDQLIMMPIDEFLVYYKQDSSDPVTSGTPVHWSPYESTANYTKLRVGPTPSANDSLKVVYGRIPAALSSDSSTIPFDNELVAGLEAACAAEIVLSAGPEKLKKLDIDKSMSTRWIEETNLAVAGYNSRQMALGMRQDRVIRSRIKEAYEG